MDMSRSTVNRVRSALRIREKSAAAIVREVKHTDRAPSGNDSNSLSAALTQEMGRVDRVICVGHWFCRFITS